MGAVPAAVMGVAVRLAVLLGRPAGVSMSDTYGHEPFDPDPGSEESMVCCPDDPDHSTPSPGWRPCRYRPLIWGDLLLLAAILREPHDQLNRKLDRFRVGAAARPRRRPGRPGTGARTRAGRRGLTDRGRGPAPGIPAHPSPVPALAGRQAPSMAASSAELRTALTAPAFGR